MAYGGCCNPGHRCYTFPMTQEAGGGSRVLLSHCGNVAGAGGVYQPALAAVSRPSCTVAAGPVTSWQVPQAAIGAAAVEQGSGWAGRRTQAHLW